MDRSTLLDAKKSVGTLADASTQLSEYPTSRLRTEMYKTALCHRWERGNCSFGKNCHFAHGANELCEKNCEKDKPKNSSSDKSSRSTVHNLGTRTDTSSHSSHLSNHHEPTEIDKASSNAQSSIRRVTFLEEGRVYIHGADKNESFVTSREESPPSRHCLRGGRVSSVPGSLRTESLASSTWLPRPRSGPTKTT